jgi:hypothetical protein
MWCKYKILRLIALKQNTRPAHVIFDPVILLDLTPYIFDFFTTISYRRINHMWYKYKMLRLITRKQNTRPDPVIFMLNSEWCAVEMS